MHLPVRRVGLFGGSFNPPHLAHLALARVARDTLGLDELRWLPAGQPWQKAGMALADGPHRAAMVAALMAGEPRMTLDLRELQRSGPTYTIDTVRGLAAEGPGTELWLVIGQDQLARLHTWREAEALCRSVRLAVAAREGQAPEVPAELASLGLSPVALPLPRMDLSSTELRQRAALGLPVDPMAGPAVARYIEQHSLYRATPGP